MTRRLQERTGDGGPQSTGSGPAAADSDKAADSAADGEAAGELDSVPPIIRLQMTTRQQRRLWRHVETIENFWETLKEIEPGVIAHLAAVATDRNWEVIFLTNRPATVGRPSQVQRAG